MKHDRDEMNLSGNGPQVSQEEGHYTEGPFWMWGLMILVSALWSLFILWAVNA